MLAFNSIYSFSHKGYDGQPGDGGQPGMPGPAGIRGAKGIHNTFLWKPSKK